MHNLIVILLLLASAYAAAQDTMCATRRYPLASFPIESVGGKANTVEHVRLVPLGEIQVTDDGGIKFPYPSDADSCRVALMPVLPDDEFCNRIKTAIKEQKRSPNRAWFAIIFRSYYRDGRPASSWQIMDAVTQ